MITMLVAVAPAASTPAAIPAVHAALPLSLGHDATDKLRHGPHLWHFEALPAPAPRESKQESGAVAHEARSGNERVGALPAHVGF